MRSGWATLRWLLLVAILAAGLVAGSAALYRDGRLRFNYPSEARFPVRGVDVSHHQGRIDWEKVRDAGIDFAFIKATEGQDHRDSRFRENWEEAGRVGLARGAYHFFTFCTPGAAQAENFLTALSGLEAELPPVADVEFAGNCRGWSTIGDIRNELAVFLEQVEVSLGRRPTIYLTNSSHRRIVAARFASFPLWVRNTFFEPSARRYPDWRFWQFADNARIAGVKGPVDLNVFCCAKADFLALSTAPDAAAR
ncbi:MAG: GH25 family lysozyme [Myxococcota bacterium]|nr:GH25 family lysozyme [Myxococcota bacterium]